MSLNKESLLKYLLGMASLNKDKADWCLDRMQEVAEKGTQSEYLEQRLAYDEYSATFETIDRIILEIKLGKFDEKK